MSRFLVLAIFALSVYGFAEEMPTSSNPSTAIEKFAGSDLIKHPTGITFTADGKLLAIESHTHFAPEDYEGPESDRIWWLRDGNGDGVADERILFFKADLVATMDIATHPNTGAIYVSTRNEILRLWDKDGDGRADPDSVERRLVFLDTDADYPHNGLSGLAFDDDGDLFFGIGENFGADYTLSGSDNSSVSDGGEGGNVWHVNRDGGDLRRFATGFWNPFGVCHAPGGHVFATDNDPSSRPPSRLHYVIEGGDYGYQYRYGRSGQHPFISWDGELPGTLPMLSGSGEAPCDVIFHEGHLFVASWADHRIERYPLTWKETHFTTKQEILVQGGNEFRPVAFAIGPDGALYCSDWVKSDYQLHGEGAVWRIEGWEPEELPMPQMPLWLRELKDESLSPSKVDDPWLVPAQISQLVEGRFGELSRNEALLKQDDLTAADRALVLLAHRKKNPDDSDEVILGFLNDPDPEVRLLGLKWICDEKLTAYREEAESIVEDPSFPELFHAAITTLARLDGSAVDDKPIQELIRKRLREKSITPSARRAAFRVLSDREQFLKVSDLENLFENGDMELRIEVMLTLLVHPDQGVAKEFAKRLLDRKVLENRVRPFAEEVANRPISELSSDSETPGLDDTQGWLEYLGAAAEASRDPVEVADHGRLVFHRHCAVCHQVDGFGRKGGPDLSTIHERGKEYILESILVPNAEVAPQYEAWEIKLADGSTRIGFMLGQKGGTHYYSDIAGNEFEINNRQINERKRIPMSLMPPGLPLQIPAGDLSDLLTWLSTKPTS